MQEQKKKILFFVAGDVPTEEDFAAAKSIGTRMFRNASLHAPGSNLEDCDFVAGQPPEDYLAKYDLVEMPKPQAKPVSESKPADPPKGKKKDDAPPPPPPPASGAISPPWGQADK